VKALVVNCTLKSSPERSNTGALADVVAAALRDGGAEVDEGHEWSHSTGQTAAANLLAVARAFEPRPMPAPE